MLVDELQPYIDGNDLVCPNVLPIPKPQRGSDNGPLFSAQALILQDTPTSTLLTSILRCISADGYLHRSPDDTSTDLPDNHYGLFAMATYFDLTIPSITLPWSICQPGLLYVRGMAARNPWTRLYSPLMACTLALSNIGEATTDTSNKLLTFTTIFGLSKRSLLCRLGGKVWLYRMRKLYPEGTLSIAKTYYGNAHPFISFWRDPC